ncbi:hypothetical protein ALP66_02638 [Pseudomonas amygdali pv. photiniae]|uniref:MmcQ/YjbR family DNA-binding protein n=1 Tax=Pseudomonas amygdali pv. photiniae TaxID=251724 RepID=A0A0P9SIV7_PSEA0|nr:Uncharacterized protein ALO53_00551 [Pseudomonas amygdali pv. photiniae]RMS51986.1 hypothetical protein ALP66_02638 [Pseudomonas amygdali pv. photiniae]
MNKTRHKEDIARFCLDLPGAREDYKWGGVRVFSVAEKKMFAVMDLVGQDLSFKVHPELFLGYVDRPGIRHTACALPGPRALDQRGRPAHTERL